MANLAAVALYRSGPVLVEALTGNSAQVGYLNLAIGLYLIVYGTVSQFAQSLFLRSPSFVRKGEQARCGTG